MQLATLTHFQRQEKCKTKKSIAVNYLKQVLSNAVLCKYKYTRPPLALGAPSATIFVIAPHKLFKKMLNLC